MAPSPATPDSPHHSNAPAPLRTSNTTRWHNPAGHDCVSRLRLDARAAVRVTPEVDAADDVWYPRFDDATPARTYAQRVDARGVGRWVVALNSPRNRNESDTPQ